MMISPAYHLFPRFTICFSLLFLRNIEADSHETKKLPFMPKHKEQFIDFNIISLPLLPMHYLLAIAACAVT